MRGLPVFPISISSDDTGCTPTGVPQGDVGGCAVGVVSRVGMGVGVTVILAGGDGEEVATMPVCVALGLEVDVGPGVGVLPSVPAAPPQPTTSKSARILVRIRPR